MNRICIPEGWLGLGRNTLRSAPWVRRDSPQHHHLLLPSILSQHWATESCSEKIQLFESRLILGRQTCENGCVSHFHDFRGGCQGTSRPMCGNRRGKRVPAIFPLTFTLVGLQLYQQAGRLYLFILQCVNSIFLLLSKKKMTQMAPVGYIVSGCL